MISGQILPRRSPQSKGDQAGWRAKSAKREYFSRMKFFRRFLATMTLVLLAFKAVVAFLSWVEKQEESETDAWVDEEEFEDHK
jgi:hypothetical protein